MKKIQAGGGPFDATDDLDAIRSSVKHAIASGYRHVDGAHFYRNEKGLGAAVDESIAEGTVRRDELFITTKVWPTHVRPELIEWSLNKSLGDLRVDYVDALLIHWPFSLKVFIAPGPDRLRKFLWIRPESGSGKC